jgi:hypothetical protein
MKPFSLTENCLDILKNEKLKKELKLLLRPAIHFLLFEIHPYVYIIILIFVSSFLLNLGMCILLIQVLYSLKLAAAAASNHPHKEDIQ